MNSSNRIEKPGKRILLVLLKAGGGLLLLGFAVLLYYYITSKELTVTCYTLQAPVSQPIRIVQLTDLHNAQFGEGNCELTARVAQQNPDLIVMTGDMLNREEESLEIVTDLISDLAEIAPVYYGYGNHETDWERNWNCDLHEQLSDAGAVVLNNDFIDLDVKGTEIRLAGYMGYYWQPHMMTHDEEQQKLERSFYKAFQDTDRYKILLNHIPTQWLDWNYIDVCHVNFVFCGHYHGGVIRIPFINRGVIAPYVGWFPPYTKGMYAGTEAVCVLSSGLGSEYAVPRINNPPEIVVVDFIE